MELHPKHLVKSGGLHSMAFFMFALADLGLMD